MRTWVCEDCEERFDEPDYREEPMEYDNGVSGAWNVAVCPCCGSENVYETCLFHEEEEEEEDVL